MDLTGPTRSPRRRLHPALLCLLGASACGGEDPAPENRSGRAAVRAPGAAPAPGSPGAEIPVRSPTPIEARLLPRGAVIGADPDASSPVLVFSAREAPARLLDWFRATGNGADFMLETEMQEGAEHVFSGRVRATGEAFMVRLAPAVAGGGTTGTIMVTKD